MLYIASALTPTPVSHTVKVSNLTGPGSTSLVLGKADRIEVWDVDAEGLSFRAELLTWGPVVGLAVVNVAAARPHVLVLVGPPNARLLLVTWSGELVVTAAQRLDPPTPALRRQEFFTAVVAHETTALVSLWTGLLARVEMEFEKAKDARRRSTAGTKDSMDVDDEGKRLVFKSSSNVNIREHNLLDLAYTNGPNGDPFLTFLWEYNGKIRLQPRQFDTSGHAFINLDDATDVVNPLSYMIRKDEEIDFNKIPFSCPAARNVLVIPGKGPLGSKLLLVVGDEHTVLYSISVIPKPPTTSTSPRASAIRRSPQAETGGIGKKRKSSTSGRSVVADPEVKWRVSPVWRVRQGFGTVLAATPIQNTGSAGSVLFGDECGRLTAIGWEFDSDETVRVGKVDLGIVSPPSALTYVDNGHVFVSSTCGDSLLVSLSQPTAKSTISPSSSSAARTIVNKGKGRAHDSVDGGAWTIVMEDDTEGAIGVRERWMNLAPVKDFAVVEEEDGRVSHLVVASGSANTNSLRVVRSGAGFEDVLSVEGVPGIQKMWTLAPGGSEPSTLLLSFDNSSAILRLDPEVAPLAAADGVVASPTIAAGLVGAGKVLVQVTPSAIHLWSDVVAGTAVASHHVDAKREIVAGAVKEDVVIIACRDGSIEALRVGSTGLESIMSAKLHWEVAALDIDVGADAGATGNPRPQTLIAISEWNGDIQIFTLEGLAAGSRVTSFHEAAFAYSLLFRDSSADTHQLLAGLSDGTFVSYDLDDSSAANELQKERVVSSLGSRPLQVLPLDLPFGGDEKVFAVGISDRLSIVFEARGHCEFSSSGKKDAVAAAAINVPSLGPCIVIATAEGLLFERLTSLKKLQVQTLDLDIHSITRIAAIQDKALAAGVVTRTLDPQTGDVLQASSVELRTSTTLELLESYPLFPNEAVTSVNGVFLNGRHYIAAGTAMFSSADAMDTSTLEDMTSFVEADKGRLLLLEGLEKEGRWTLKMVGAQDYKAPVTDIAAIHGFLAVATTAKVSILRLEPLDHGVANLKEVSTSTSGFDAHYLHVLPKSADSPEDRLVVGDAMRSITVLGVDPESGIVRNEQIDMSSHSVTALSDVQDGGPGAIIADDNANLLTFRLGDDGIEPAASFGLHNSIARFRTGSLAPVSGAPDTLRPGLLFATAEGRLGIIGTLGGGATRTLNDLQRNMNKYHKGPGGVDWRAFRRGGNAMVPKETAGFIDGDFVQQFLDVDAPQAQRILRGSSAPEVVLKLVNGHKEAATRADVVRLLEATAGMH